MSIRRKALALAAACAAMLLAPFALPAAQADERGDLAAAQQEKRKEIEQARKALSGVDAAIRDTYLELLEVEAKVSEAAVQLKDAQDALAVAEREAEAVTSQLEAARRELERIATDISDGQKRIDSTRSSLGAVARAQYRGDTTPSAMELLVGSTSARDFLKSYSTSEAIVRTQSLALSRIAQATARNETRAARQKDVERQIGRLKAEADRLVAERARKEAAAKSKNDEVLALQASLEAKQRAFEEHSASLQAQISSNEAESAQIAAQMAAIDESNRLAVLARAQYDAEQSVSGNSFIAPMVPGATIVSEFGWRIHPIQATPRLHKGVDFAVGCGVPQQAPGNGTVAQVVRDDPGGGNYIVFDLGDVGGHVWQVWSLHFDSVVVSPGQPVTKGQVVGYTGTTGASTGCHVHQEVWMDGQPINPRAVL